MIQAGERQELIIVKETGFGVYLAENKESSEKVLLPKKEVDEGMKPGTKVEVFVYLDSSDRLIATRREPMVTIGGTAVLKVKDVTKIGAFLDWGLEKDLLLPFREQTGKVYPGDECLVALYLDKSSRLCATMHIYDYLRTDGDFTEGDHVDGIVYEILDSFGAFVAVADKYSALIPHNEMNRELHVGDNVHARIKEIREDGKLTLSLQEKLPVQMGMDAESILARLEAEGGFLPFHDKTSPEIIKREFKMSKNAYKRAIGRLMKEKKIEIRSDGIKLI